MTVLINILVAALLTLLAINCLLRRSRYFSKPEYFFLFILATGMFQTGGFTIGGLNLSALRLLVWILLVCYALLAFKNTVRKPKRTPLDLPILFYSLFLCWCLWSLIAHSPSLMYGSRALLKLMYPFLILLLARKVTVSEKVPVYLHITFFAALIFSIFISGISEKIPFLSSNPLLERIFWGRSTFADHAAIMVGVGLALRSAKLAGKPLFPFHAGGIRNPRKRRKKTKRFFQHWQYTAAIVWLCASPLAVANRTGLLATSGSISTFLLYRYRLRAVPFIVAIFFMGLWIVLYMPSFRDSTFRGKHVTVQELQYLESSEIDSSGRFALWDYLMKRFYRPNPMVGSGLGSVQQFLYRTANRGAKVPHSEYVALLCDVGLIGLGLYLLTGISGLFLGVQAVFQREKNLKILGMVVASSFIALFWIMGFDNPFQYALGVHQFPYAFLGMLLAVRSQPGRKTIASRNRSSLA